jgi:release factor glutamine methyltransferase
MNFEKQPYITVEDALSQAHILISYNDARILLQHVLKINHAHIITHPEQSLTPIQIHTFQLLVKRRASGEPISYILGECEFYSIKFKVTPSVLIPRQETELLVDLALEKISSSMSCKILDLGTGSGVIAITIAKHRTLSNVTAADNSANAIAIAKTNADCLSVNNVNFIKSDWFQALTKRKFDLIISNPPYIALNDPHLNQHDLRFEPKLALVAGQDGMVCIQTIISSATSYINAGGWLLLEHGYNQAKITKRLLKEAGFISIFSRSDLAGIPRVSGGRYDPPFKKLLNY